MNKTDILLENAKKNVMKNAWFYILLLGFGVLFFIKLFTNVLYDDEIGFYLSPTSRGVIFSFFIYESTGYHILHMGLSAILNKLGSVYLGIRGVSFIAWLVSNVVIYKACRLKCGKESSTIAVLIYNMLYCVNFYAVAGRGYMLINLCFALALYFSMRLAEDMKNRKLWIGFMIANICGFWTISTYMYAFFTVVIVFGLYLLIQKDYKGIWTLFWHCVITGIGVFCVYCPVFICTRLFDLYKQGDIDKSVQVFISTLLQNPIACLVDGIRSFLDRTNYYITYKSYTELLHGLGEFLEILATFLFFKPFPILSVICYAVMWLINIVLCVVKKHRMLYLCGAVGLSIFLPIMFLQRIFPFERLFAYLAVAIAISMAGVIEELPVKISVARRYIGVVLALVAVVLYLQLDYKNPWHDTIDNSVEKAVELIPEQLKEEEQLTVYVDEFQQRNYMILWGRMNQIEIEFGEDNPVLVILRTGNENSGVSIDHMNVYYTDENIIAYY